MGDAWRSCKNDLYNERVKSLFNYFRFMKERILSLISNQKRNMIEPLVDEIYYFYNDKIELKTTQNRNSRFIRDIIETPEGFVPFGLIELSNSFYSEEALVHELLHLAMPLTHQVYTIGFDYSDKGLFEITTLIQNVLEHDMFLNEYLDLGFSIDKFLAEPNLIINYNKRRKEGSLNSVYWIHEYLRLSITLNHLPLRLKPVCRKAIDTVRKLAFKEFNYLENDFKKIKNWIDSKKFHEEHFIEIRTLFEIFNIEPPTKILSIDEPGKLKEILF